MDDIYKMELHENICIDGLEETVIIRVPGGWIYRFWQPYPRHTRKHPDNYRINSVFVPFNNEFQGG